jgi:hypothetical protein
MKFFFAFAGLTLIFLPLLPELRAEEAATRQWLAGTREKALQALPLLPLKYDASGRAVIQYVDPSRHFFLHDGHRCVGFRFRTPQRIDGDFVWMFLLRSVDGPTLMAAGGTAIYRATGELKENIWQDFKRSRVSSYPELREMFPYTVDLDLNQSPGAQFLPDQEYIVMRRMLEHEQAPEFAVAIAFARPGTPPESVLPIGPRKVPQPTPPPAKSIEGDPF